jgi:hypothetical protein
MGHPGFLGRQHRVKMPDATWKGQSYSSDTHPVGRGAGHVGRRARRIRLIRAQAEPGILECLAGARRHPVDLQAGPPESSHIREDSGLAGSGCRPRYHRVLRLPHLHETSHEEWAVFIRNNPGSRNTEPMRPPPDRCSNLCSPAALQSSSPWLGGRERRLVAEHCRDLRVALPSWSAWLAALRELGASQVEA